MGRIQPPLAVNLFVGMLSYDENLFQSVERRLEEEFGPVDLTSDVILFNFTDHYEKEMGRNIRRKFISFERLIEPGRIAPIKVFTNRMEEDFSKMHFPVSRPINLDPGYITSAKLVLATTKDYFHRIYLEKGIFAEITLCFRKGCFEAFEWTYPDYRTKEYADIFNHIRRLYIKKKDE